MEWIHLDMMVPLPEFNSGNKYTMVMSDQYRKWVEIQPLKNISAETAAHTAVDQFFTTFGYPLQIHTDLGRILMEICSKRCVSFYGSLRHVQHPTSQV